MADGLLKGLHIAVTRPVDQALSICEAIEHHGGNAIPFPLIAISVLEDYHTFEQAIATLEYAHWAIFISTNAVDNALPRILKRAGKLPKNLKFAAIGPQTAKQLSRYNIHQVLSPLARFDSEALLALPEMHSVANQTIIIFRGLGGRDVLAKTLRSRGANVIFAECYRRTNPQTDTQALSRLWQQGQLDAVIVTSSEAMRNLVTLAEKSEWLQQITLCVNHARIAELPLQLGLKVLLADAPGDGAMINCLSQLVNNHG
ncbi:MAG: uroporphyrinogen-III synthase [Methylotenera sp.]|nr:uroporphyrinogen-III synthase [Methylotenera sp.]MSP99765.1 uroporphyrinogen-III synthase [Methylotenera sp.]